MGSVQRTWIKDNSSESKMYADSVYMYDAGNFIGLLTVKGETNTKQWSGFTLVSRVKTLETIEEILEPAHEFTVPMHFYSVEKYPATIESSTLWIPGWKIQLVKAPNHQQNHQQKQEALGVEALGSQQSQPSLQKQHRHQGQHQPFLQPAQSHQSPSFQPLPKSPSEKQGLSRHPLQNKSNNASRPKASLSSNPTFHAKPRQSIQGTSGGLPLPSSQGGHISPLSQQHPLSQPSPCPPLPSRPEGSNPQSTSSSPNHSNSKRHLPSQQARRQREGKSQHPIFSQTSSHE